MGKALYLLSSRQSKELLVQHMPLWICIPLPPQDDPPDLLAWARVQFDPDVARFISRAHIEWLHVVPHRSGDRSTIENALGRIAFPGTVAWGFPIPCVVVEFTPTRINTTRTVQRRLQWPCDVVFDGARVFKQPHSDQQ